MPKITPELLTAGILFHFLLFGFVCFNLYKALKQVKPQNQKLKPYIIWLLLIPGVHLMVNFIIVPLLSDSLKEELADRDFDIQERPGFTVGLAYSILTLTANIPIFPLPIMSILSIAFLIVLVWFIFKINWYRKILENDLLDESAIEQE